MLTFVLYGVGMGLVITVLTVALALARSGVVARFRELLPVMNRIAGGLMVVTGAYVAYYGYYELRLLNYGGYEDDWVIDTALRIQTRLAELMPNMGNYGWYVVGGDGADRGRSCLGAARLGSRAVLCRRDPDAETPASRQHGRGARSGPLTVELFEPFQAELQRLRRAVLGGRSPAGRRRAR